MKIRILPETEHDLEIGADFMNLNVSGSADILMTAC
jgi:hypothetical protein